MRKYKQLTKAQKYHIYQHVHRDKKRGGSLFWHLRYKNKRYAQWGKKAARLRIRNKVSIDERPDIVNQKIRYGGWEADTIIGKQQQGSIVTIVEG